MTQLRRQPLLRSLVPIATLALIWGCNWPVLKMGVTEIAPLTFRSLTLPLAALGMFGVAWRAGDAMRVPRAWWPKLAGLAALNIAVWNALVLFGLQQMPAGRSSILAYTMPIWATAIATLVLHEPLPRRKLAGLALGTAGMALLLGVEVHVIRSAPLGTLLILAAAVSWGLGTVLLRKWKLPVPQTSLTGWMVLLGSLPLAILAPLFDAQPLTHTLAHLSPRAWFSLVYNIALAGTIAHWAWYTLARNLPVAVSSLSSLPVPVVGVFAGMVLLDERPGAQEWLALALVVLALFTVLYQPPRRAPAPAAAPAPGDSG